MSEFDLLSQGGFDLASITTRGLDIPATTTRWDWAGEPPVVDLRLPEALKVPAPGKLPSDLANFLSSGSITNQLKPFYLDQDEEVCTYAGSDIRVILEVRGSAKLPKQILEVATLTISIHREKDPVPALGYIGAKGYARGRRTIAGTIVLTQFNLDLLYRYFDEIKKDVDKGTSSPKTDQLPPFNLTIMFCDEFGNSSYQRILGCDLVTDGTVYSAHDMMTERSITYYAADFTPMLPLGKDGKVPVSDVRVMGAERSVRDAILAKRESVTSVFTPLEVD